MITAAAFRYFWDVLVNPRLGNASHQPDAYVWGGSFSAGDINQGSDCSGAASAELSAFVRGPGMIYERQFFTGTFAGINPGDTGPFAGIEDTRDLVCIAHPSDADPVAAMIIAIRQMADPTDAHMICAVPTTVGGPWTTIEMGGPPDDYHLNVTAIDNPEFDQWFYLKGPIEGAPTPPLPPPPAPQPLSQADQGALIIIQTGQKVGMTPLGCQMGLACALDESDLQMYANINDPASMLLPHTIVGSDHMSVGPFQQQDVGWGPLTCRMDWACSATTFFQHLETLNYNDPRHSPGWYIQQVQRSADPTGSNYDLRFNAAVALYNRLTALPAPGDDDMAAVPQEEWNAVRDALLIPRPSKSRYGDPTIDWAPMDFVHNIDEVTYDLLTEHDAALGNPAAMARIAKAAAAGDEIAQRFLDTLATGPVTPGTGVPTATFSQIIDQMTQQMAELKTMLGGILG